jgi:hypothetical protein
MENPKLIENSVKNYLFQTLQKCHINRVSIYYYCLNLGILVLFFGIVGLVLYYSYKNKLTPYESQQKMLRDQQYILSKIRYYQEDKKNTQQSQYSSITNLPYVIE